MFLGQEMEGGDREGRVGEMRSRAKYLQLNKSLSALHGT